MGGGEGEKGGRSNGGGAPAAVLLLGHLFCLYLSLSFSHSLSHSILETPLAS